MNSDWLAMALSIVLPAVPLVMAIFLLRRAVKPTNPHWFSLAASGMVFAMSGLWLTKAVDKLVAICQGSTDPSIHEWLTMTLQAGPGMAFSLVVLSGGFWAYLAIRQRTATK